MRKFSFGCGNFSDSYRSLLKALLCLYVFECVVGGSGQWASFHGVSARIALFFVCFVVSFPLVIRDRRILLQGKYPLLLVAFFVYLCFSSIYSFYLGNSASFIKADITSFLALALMPAFCVVFRSKDSLTNLMVVVFIGATLTAVLTVGVHLALAFLNSSQVTWFNDLINEKHLGGLANLGEAQYRVYFRSQIFLQVAIVFGMWRSVSCHSRIEKAIIWLCEGLLISAIIISLARGLWLGLAAGLLLLLFLGAKQWKSYLLSSVVSLAVVVALSLVSFACYGTHSFLSGVLGRFDPALIVVFSDDESESNRTTSDGASPKASSEKRFGSESYEGERGSDADEVNALAATLRVDSLDGALQAFSEAPAFGKGLGYNLDSVRNDGKIEYTYLDCLMKLGAVGFVLYMCVFFLPLLFLFRGRLKHPFGTPVGVHEVIGIAYFSVAVTSYFNPFLNCPMGICLLCLCCVACLQATDELQRE